MEILRTREQLIDIIKNSNTNCRALTNSYEEVSGLCITTLYFRLEWPILYVPYDDKVYVIGNSEYGRILQLINDNLVSLVREATKRYGIIGTMIALMYVTQGTKDVPNGAIYHFVPFLPPNESVSTLPAYIYDLKTLPYEYFNEPFEDFVDTDVFHLLHLRDDHTTLLALPASHNLKKGDIIYVDSILGIRKWS